VRKRINPYYEREFKKLPRLVGKNWTPNLIIDIGGNLGQSSMAFDQLFNSDQLVIFEPNPPMAQQCRNLKIRQIKNFEVHQFGLANSQEHLNLYTPEYNGVTFWGLASLNETQASSLIGIDNIWKFDPNKLKIREVAVELRTLDSFKLKPDFIKIDVEGFELEVINGGMGTITSCKPLILVECTGTHKAIQNLLSPLGYKNYELQGGTWVESQGLKLNQIFLMDRSVARLS
jgi:FkbM family methyltransferase